MKLQLFDTETTGLPKNRENATKGSGNWPHLVSIAWVIVEDDKIVKSEYYIVKPQWIIPQEVINIHGITQLQAETEGIELREVLKKFLVDNQGVDRIVCHNLAFDMNVLLNAILWDAKMGYPVLHGMTFCTMTTTRTLCNIPFANGRGIKNPKLSELYRIVMKKEPNTTELHNALYDTHLLTEIVLTSDYLRPMMGLPIVSSSVTNAYKTHGKTLII